MEATQNFTALEPKHQAWVDFCALGGMTIDAEGKVGKKSAEELAKELGVVRRTLYLWQDSIPNFWDLVKGRRNELYSRDAVTLIYKAMLKKAATGDVAAAKLILNQARVLEAEKSENKSEVEHSGSVKVEGLDDAELEAKLEQIIKSRQA